VLAGILQKEHPLNKRGGGATHGKLWDNGKRGRPPENAEKPDDVGMAQKGHARYLYVHSNM